MTITAIGPGGPATSSGSSVGASGRLHLNDVAQAYGLTFDPTSAGMANVANRANNTAVLNKAMAVASANINDQPTEIQIPQDGSIALNPIDTIPGNVTLFGTPLTPEGTILNFRSSSGGTSLDKTKIGGDTAIWAAPGANPNHVALDGLTIQGEFPSNIPGTSAPAEQYGTGIRMWDAVGIRNIRVAGFCYGIDMRCQHWTLENIECGGNWSGIHMGARYPNQGDGYASNLILTGNRWASISLHATHYINGCTMESVHLSCAHGVWKMAGSRIKPNYSTGTISVPNGSTTVTGVGTAFLANVREGDYIWFTGIGSIAKIVRKVISDTQIEMHQALGGASVSGIAYKTGDGPVGASFDPTPHAAILQGNTLLDWAFEGCSEGAVTSEDAYNGAAAFGTVGGNTWTDSGIAKGNASNSANGHAVFDVQQFSNNRLENCSFEDMNVKAGWIRANYVTNNDFGDLSLFVNNTNVGGLPIVVNNPANGALTMWGNFGYTGQGPCRVVKSSGIVHPGDLMMDFSGDAYHGLTLGAQIAANRLGMGVALTGASNSDEAIVVLNPGGFGRLSVAPCVQLTAPAAPGATSISVRSTARLGAPAAVIGSLTDDAAGSVPTVKATGVTITNATTLACAALPGALSTGDVLYSARAANTVTARAWLKGRYGVASGGSTATDVGQVVAATSHADTEARVVGQANQFADNGGRFIDAMLT